MFLKIHYYALSRFSKVQNRKTFGFRTRQHVFVVALFRAAEQADVPVLPAALHGAGALRHG